MPTCLQCGANVELGVTSCQACGLPIPGTPFQLAATQTPAGVLAAPLASAIDVPSAPAVAPARAARQRAFATIALVVVAVVTLLLVTFVLVWSAFSLAINAPWRTDIVPPPGLPKIDTPPIVGGPIVDPVTPPSAEQETPRSSVPITTPGNGTAQRTALMDVARVRLEIQDRFIVYGLYVQGDRAVGILTPDGATDRYLVVWARTGGKWDVTWHGTPGSGGQASLENPDLGLSAEIIDKLGL